MPRFRLKSACDVAMLLVLPKGARADTVANVASQMAYFCEKGGHLDILQKRNRPHFLNTPHCRTTSHGSMGGDPRMYARALHLRFEYN